MNTTNNKMALSPGKIEGANNLPVRIAIWNTRTLKETDTIYILLHETERMGIDIIVITETHWTSDIPTIKMDISSNTLPPTRWNMQTRCRFNPEEAFGREDREL